MKKFVIKFNNKNQGKIMYSIVTALFFEYFLHQKLMFVSM